MDRFMRELWATLGEGPLVVAAVLVSWALVAVAFTALSIWVGG